VAGTDEIARLLAHAITDSCNTLQDAMAAEYADEYDHDTAFRSLRVCTFVEYSPVDGSGSIRVQATNCFGSASIDYDNRWQAVS
jgi:hypothetical protein